MQKPNQLTQIKSKERQLLEVLFGHCVSADIYIVGGYVRDHLLGLESKDIDFEIFNVDYQHLLPMIQWGIDDLNEMDSMGSIRAHCELLGNRYQALNVVIHFKDERYQYDINLPRKERAYGHGRGDIEVGVDPFLSLGQAVLRRDLTVNALMENFRTGEVIDPTGKGIQDLHDHILRHVSEQFSEDATRCLRLLSLAGRLNAILAPETSQWVLNKMFDRSFYESIEESMIQSEWIKWASKSTHPSMGIKALAEIGWLQRYYKIIDALKGVPQNPVHHPEGDVYAHTLQGIDFAAWLARKKGLSKERTAILVMSMLLHDVGKAESWLDGQPVTHVNDKGDIVSPNHAKAGIEPARQFLESIYAPNWLAKEVLKMVEWHMCHIGQINPKHLFLKLKDAQVDLEMLEMVVICDINSRRGADEKLPSHNPLSEDGYRYSENMQSVMELSRQPEPPIYFFSGKFLQDQGFDLPALQKKVKQEGDLSVIPIAAMIYQGKKAQDENAFDTLEKAIQWLEDQVQTNGFGFDARSFRQNGS